MHYLRTFMAALLRWSTSSRTSHPVCGRLVRLGRCAPDVLGPGTLRPFFAKVEFHAVALFQILEAFAIHGAAVKKVTPSPHRP